jgi:hypothetical protein
LSRLTIPLSAFGTLPECPRLFPGAVPLGVVVVVVVEAGGGVGGGAGDW